MDNDFAKVKVGDVVEIIGWKDGFIEHVLVKVCVQNGEVFYGDDIEDLNNYEEEYGYEVNEENFLNIVESI